jgi:hypothetical protein
VLASIATVSSHSAIHPAAYARDESLAAQEGVVNAEGSLSSAGIAISSVGIAADGSGLQVGLETALASNPKPALEALAGVAVAVSVVGAVATTQSIFVMLIR